MTTRTLLVFLLALSGCAPTETGNPSLTTTGMTLTAHSTEPSRVAIEPDAGGSAIDRMWVSVASIDLTSCHSEPPETAVAGPFVEDLVHEPRRAHELDTTFDRFCAVSIELTPALADPEGGAPELVGHSLVLHGRRADSVPFRISSARTASLVLHVPDGVALAEEPRRLLFAFDLARLFSALDPATATVGGDGTIRIDASNNTSLLHALEGTIDGSASLHHDLDRDGTLDPIESAQLNH